MSRPTELQTPDHRDASGGGRPVMAALDPDVFDEAVVASAIDYSYPDLFVVLASVARPRPLVTHYWFMSEFGSMLGRYDRVLPEGPGASVTRASAVLDQSDMAYVVDEVTCRESAAGRRYRRLVAEALAVVAARHDVEVIVVGQRRRPRRGQTIASQLRDLTGRIVVEVPRNSSIESEDGTEVIDRGGRRSLWQRIPSTLAPRSARTGRSWGQQGGLLHAPVDRVVRGGPQLATRRRSVRSRTRSRSRSNSRAGA